MAIYHLSCKVISRSKGKSSVASSAYRSCEKIVDERTGEVSDYKNKKGLEYSEILIPENSPELFKNRKILWNEVEKVEKRKDSQLAKEIEVGLPKELSRAEQVNLLKEFVKDNFINHGMIADINLHDTGNGNPHAHIMLTTRYVDENGFGKKNRDWNDKELLKSWRENWSIKTNLFLEKNNINERVDHRSYEDRGINKIPTIHLGVSAHAMEKKGIKTDRGNINRDIKKYNNNIMKIEELQKQKLEIEKSLQVDEPPEREKNLLEIKKDYVDLKISYDENYNKIRELENKISDAKSKLEDLLKFKETREHQEITLNKLREKRANAIGIFKGKERKELDIEIEFQISIMNDTLKFYKSSDIENITEQSSNSDIIKYKDGIEKLKDDNQNINLKLNNLELDYKYRLINNSIKGIQEPNKKFKSNNTIFNIELNKIENNLNKITYDDLDKILEMHPYDKNLKVFSEYQKQEQQKEQEKSRTQSHSDDWDLER